MLRAIVTLAVGRLVAAVGLATPSLMMMTLAGREAANA